MLIACARKQGNIVAEASYRLNVSATMYVSLFVDRITLQNVISDDVLYGEKWFPQIFIAF